MTYFILNIFLSAFLLFQIQPIIAKYILPWFGGTPAVWTTVQMYFQLLLTVGYAYANWMIGRTRDNRRVFVHTFLIFITILQIVALGFLWKSPVTPDISWRPQGNSFPILAIFILLTISVGPAYFLLSTNSPIMQAWFSRAYPKRSPYALYALSNTGSLLALFTYPLFVEPNTKLNEQGWYWATGFLLFAALTTFGAIKSIRNLQIPHELINSAIDSKPAPDGKTQIMWLLLSGCASILLLATTSHMTQEVAVVPFLWVLPLIVYLLTFIIAFSNEKWYPQRVIFYIYYICTLFFAFAMLRGPNLGVPFQIIIFTLSLFVGSLACHGELFRLRPDPAHLTQFYLMVSIGGALGGIFVNLIAPLIFKGFWEFPLGVLLSWALIMYLRIKRGPEAGRKFFFKYRNAMVILSFSIIALVSYAFTVFMGDTLLVDRNFFGLVRVDKAILPTSNQTVHLMINGITVHGMQYVDPILMHIPTAYYSETSGVGLAILNNPKYGKDMRVGVLGMGIGVLAAYSQPGDNFRMYEINPIAIRLAAGEGGYFSFISDSPAEMNIIPGDGRISLEHELLTTGSNQFDILIIDAFSSDSIPVHLIDKEAIAIYLAHLKPDGVLAFHITNNYLDLRPVIWKLAEYNNLQMAYIPDTGDGESAYSSQWTLLTKNVAFLNKPAISSRISNTADFNKNLPLWTDNFSNLFQLLR